MDCRRMAMAVMLLALAQTAQGAAGRRFRFEGLRVRGLEGSGIAGVSRRIQRE
jgi:hypothetical protein